MDLSLSNPWIFAIVTSFLGSVLFGIFIIIFEPLRNAFFNAGKWIKLLVFNPNLETEIVLSGEINETKPEIFFSILNEVLKSITGKAPIRTDEIIKTTKEFDNYSLDILVSPLSHTSSSEVYDYFTIIIKFQSLRLRKLNRSLQETQNFLFKDLVTALHRKFEFYNPIIEKESVSVNFDDKPSMLKLLKDLNVHSIHSIEQGIDISLTENKIKFTGSLSDQVFLRFENVVKQNLTL